MFRSAAAAGGGGAMTAPASDAPAPALQDGLFPSPPVPSSVEVDDDALNRVVGTGVVPNGVAPKGDSLVGGYLREDGGPHYREMTGPDSVSPLPGWQAVARTLDRLGPAGAADLVEVVERLIEDDGVTYTPHEGTGDRSPVLGEHFGPLPCPDGAAGWRLDPLPVVVDAADWAIVEPGLTQRSRLLDLMLTDLYGRRRVLTEGLLPPELVFEHEHYLRSAHGITIPGSHQLVFHAADVARGPDGSFLVLADRTQTPSGSGYAMVDRRVLTRAQPDLLRTAAPRGLSAFFHTMRLSLAAVAPTTVEDPRTVVLSPGTHSEAAFDQAYLASLLGVPLVESADLALRGGSLWMRSMGRLEPVHVVVRRVDAALCDPLDLRPGSSEGIVGLTEACRQGTVSVVNTLGSGVLENPGFIPFLPDLARHLLDEPLSLPSVPTFWCGDPRSLSHVLAHLDAMVVRPTGSGAWSVPARLSGADRAELVARIRASPTRWVGQAHEPWSQAPVVGRDGLHPAEISLRLFTVAAGDGYAALPGGLARAVVPAAGGPGATGAPSSQGVAKDVWVRSGLADPAERRRDRVWLHQGPLVEAVPAEAMSSPRVLEDLFWLGRYAERTEDLTRLTMVSRVRAEDFAARPDHLGAGCVPVLLAAVSQVSGTTPPRPGVEPVRWIGELMVRPQEAGSVAHALSALRENARSVRDQLSDDAWLVLGAADRALAELGALSAAPARGTPDGGVQTAQEALLASLLGLAGLIGETMIRDPGWYLLDLGRRLERALQVTALLSAAVTTRHSPAVDSVLAESVLAAAESGVTYRRRYRGRIQIGTLLDLLLVDPGNPRSVAYQIAQGIADVAVLPNASSTARPRRLLEDIASLLRRCRPADLEGADASGRRAELADLLDQVHQGLRAVADAVARQYFWRPRPMRPLGSMPRHGARPGVFR